MSNENIIRVKLDGPLVVLGFGSIGRGLLPMIEKHFELDYDRFYYVDPSDRYADILQKSGVTHVREFITPENYEDVLRPLLTTGGGQAMCVQVGIDISSLAIIKMCRDISALYVDASIEPWPGFYNDADMKASDRTVYALRESMRAEKPNAPAGTSTAVSSCGANPGLVSWLIKQGLVNLVQDLKLDFTPPQTREEWARLMQAAGVKGVHVAERDTQEASFPKPLGAFVNTWSSAAMIDEATQPAELGWGTHEKWIPPDGHHHDKGCKSGIYLLRPGGNTGVRTWCPTPGAQVGFLVPHHEAISTSDYYTIGTPDKPTYRLTCHYAYHPCNLAVLSLREFFSRGCVRQENLILIDPKDIVSGASEMGVLLYGHAKNAYWFGTHLTNEEAMRQAPHQNATGMQVCAGVLAGMVWAAENPRAGLVEPEEMDYKRCLDVVRRYLGKVFGEYTDWTPLDSASDFFPEDLDREDPWQFKNVLVR